jgi:hypothetical protein
VLAPESLPIDVRAVAVLRSFAAVRLRGDSRPTTFDPFALDSPIEKSSSRRTRAILGGSSR